MPGKKLVVRGPDHATRSQAVPAVVYPERMKNITSFLAATLLITPLVLFLHGCGCGFDCNNGNNNDEPTLLTLGFSDALPDELKQVVITVDSITLVRSGAEDVVIDTFTIDDLNITDADTFQMDLLDYRGVNQLLVVEDFPIDKGTYTALSLALVDGDLNSSYVQEADDTLKEIAVADSLSLPGFSLSSDTGRYTVEFGLAQSLYQADADTYRLTSDGIRVENSDSSANVSGLVDSSLFDTVSPCDAKPDPESGNRLYLYEGINLDEEKLGDVFNNNSETVIPPDTLAPFAITYPEKNNLTGNWIYAFGYLPEGDYTLVFACDTAADDTVDYDGLTIPLPDGQVYEFTLAAAEEKVCNIGADSSC